MVKIENHYCIIKLSEIEDNNQSQHSYLVQYYSDWYVYYDGERYTFMDLQLSFLLNFCGVLINMESTSI